MMPSSPRVNFDEASELVIAETRQTSGTGTRDSLNALIMSISSNGTRNLFMMCEPQAGLASHCRNGASDDEKLSRHNLNGSLMSATRKRKSSV